MKLSLAILALSLVSSFAAQAQNGIESQVKSEIRGLLREVNTELSYTDASPEELRQVRDNLVASVDILRGGSNYPGRPDFICVSRDNDGHEPFQIAIRNPQNFTETKVPGAVLRQQECKTALASIRYVANAALLCVSRDNDGQNPYALKALDLGSLSMKAIAVYNNQTSCNNAITTARLSRTHMAVCASRDNDGQSPYARFIYALREKTVIASGETFSSIEACNTAP